jgi:hypothetical protein
MFSKTILGNVDACRTECEISDETATTVAVVYESHQGWQANVLRPLKNEEVAAFNASIEAAKQSLSRYVNRMGNNPPEETTAGALSLWLMQKDDGTVLGIDLNKHNKGVAAPLRDVSPDVAENGYGQSPEHVTDWRQFVNCA